MLTQSTLRYDIQMDPELHSPLCYTPPEIPRLRVLVWPALLQALSLQNILDVQRLIHRYTAQLAFIFYLRTQKHVQLTFVHAFKSGSYLRLDLTTPLRHDVSYWQGTNPISLSASSKVAFHSRHACFSPYIALLSLRTLSLHSSSSKIVGCFKGLKGLLR